ncbi:unnamed protein product, partial [marine sediment metagenome]
TAKYYDSGWKDIPGSTNSKGVLLHDIPGIKPNVSFKMSYAGYTQQKSNVDIAANSYVVFQGTKVIVKLLDSSSVGISGGVVKYYASGWKTFGTTDSNGEVAKELLPGKYSFRMTYVGYTQQKSNVDITSTNPLVFQAINMVVSLQDSGGAGISGGQAKYYASGWKTFGTTDGTGNTPGVELLPGKYSFKMTYAGYTQQKSNVDISSTNPLVFTTVKMQVKLEDSSGGGLAGGVVKYYASGWKNFGASPHTTDSTGFVPGDMELLPGK